MVTKVGSGQNYLQMLKFEIMKKALFSPNSKVSGYSIEPSRVILFGKNNTCRVYDSTNFSAYQLAMIKAVVLSGQIDMLWNGQYKFIV